MKTPLVAQIDAPSSAMDKRWRTSRSHPTAKRSCTCAAAITARTGQRKAISCRIRAAAPLHRRCRCGLLGRSHNPNCLAKAMSRPFGIGYGHAFQYSERAGARASDRRSETEEDHPVAAV